MARQRGIEEHLKGIERIGREVRLNSETRKSALNTIEVFGQKKQTSASSCNWVKVGDQGAACLFREDSVSGGYEEGRKMVISPYSPLAIRLRLNGKNSGVGKVSIKRAKEDGKGLHTTKTGFRRGPVWMADWSLLTIQLPVTRGIMGEISASYQEIQINVMLTWLFLYYQNNIYSTQTEHGMDPIK